MEYLVLGPLELRRDGASIPLPTGRPLQLLALLLLHRGRQVSTDHLIDCLWGAAPPKTARTALQVHVSKLRQALGDPSPIATVERGYRLDADDEELDASRYARLIRDAERLVGVDPLQALKALDAADGDWRGSPYIDVADQPWAATAIANLDELARTAVEIRGDAELRLGRHGSIVTRLRDAADAEPLREVRWQQLMVALYRGGRQSDALRTFQGARERLADELGVEPGPDLRDLEHRILTHDPDLATDRPRLRSPGNLTPSITRLHGRRDEVQDVVHRLGVSRLVTLSGPAGIGKTTIAVQAAAGCRSAFPDGVWVVDLTAATTPALVGPVIASVLGLSASADHGPRVPQDLIRTYLHRRRALLVLDACDQVTAEVAGLVQAILTDAAGLRVLATSRTPLALPTESVLRVGPLPVPPAGASDEDYAHSPAVELFVERSGGRTPDPAEWQAIGELCRYLEGIPLAIELAAAVSRGLAVSDLASQLSGRLALAAPDGGPSVMRAAVDWSHALLAPGDRVLLRRLSVFPAGFTLPGAHAVAAPDQPLEQVTGSLARLVHASLIAIDPRAISARYTLFDTVREYAAEQLVATREQRLVHDRLAEHLIAEADRVRPNHVGPANYDLLWELDAEHDNARAMLSELLDSGDAATALRLAVALHEYWAERGHWAEGSAWLQRALELYGPARDLLRARALLALARTESSFTAIVAHHDGIDEAYALVRDAADTTPTDRYGASLMRAIVAAFRADAGTAKCFLDEAAEAATGFEDDLCRAWVENLIAAHRGLALVLEGDLLGARAAQHECATRFEELGDPGYAGRVLMYGGTISGMLDDNRGAREELSRSVELCASCGVRATEAHSRLALGLVAAELGDEDASTLVKDARTTLTRVGDVRCRAVAERTLGQLAADAGDDRAALRWLRQALPDLGDTDERAFAVALADVARLYRVDGRDREAAALAEAARWFAPRLGLPLSAAEQRRLDAGVRAATDRVDDRGEDGDVVDGGGVRPISVDEALVRAGVVDRP
jgi:predicted ATPase/DNA-binding SARP family transcriptional activator